MYIWELEALGFATLISMYLEGVLPEEAHKRLCIYAARLGLVIHDPAATFGPFVK